MTYFNPDQQLSMIKAIVDSYEELGTECSKVEKIKEILNINKTLENRDRDAE